MRRAIEGGLPTGRIRREAARLDGICRARTGDLDGAERVFRAILDDASEGERVEALDWLARIAWQRRRQG